MSNDPVVKAITSVIEGFVRRGVIVTPVGTNGLLLRLAPEEFTAEDHSTQAPLADGQVRKSW